MESRTIRSTHHFLKIAFVFRATPPEVSKELCAGVIAHSMRQIIGICGHGLCNYELIHWTPNSGVLQVMEKHVPIVRFCLTLIKSCNGQECRLDVLKTGACLAALC
eukprot:GEMP01068895.1.p3 GENE.GEMP01068895.1~~GEMP01068895.1.p3  ORF type:complete len:106 (+),score=11.62 GEMP01068895.1:191-508(+)